MTKFAIVQWLGHSAIITSLLLISGCRSASVKSPSLKSGSLPYFRSYEQPEPKFDNSYQPAPDMSTPPTPPGILPMPGFSEPANPESEVPPPPTAQKSRWKLIPSAFKRLSVSTTQADVHQTTSKSDDRLLSAKPHRTKSSVPTLRDETEEIVQPRLSSLRSVAGGPELTDPSDSIVRENLEPTSISKSNEFPVITPSRKPIVTRYGVIRTWPNRQTDKAEIPTAGSGALGDSPVINSRPVTEENMPLLLPPNP